MDKERRESLLGMIEARVQAARTRLFDTLDKELDALGPGMGPTEHMDDAEFLYREWLGLWELLEPEAAKRHREGG